MPYRLRNKKVKKQKGNAGYYKIAAADGVEIKKVILPLHQFAFWEQCKIETIAANKKRQGLDLASL
jgi:hypothetical protein